MCHRACPTVIWIVTLVPCVSQSQSQSNEGMRLAFSHIRMRLQGKRMYIQILELRSLLESTTSKSVSRSSPKHWNAIQLLCNRASRCAFGLCQRALPGNSQMWSVGSEHFQDHSQQSDPLHREKEFIKIAIGYS